MIDADDIDRDVIIDLLLKRKWQLEKIEAFIKELEPDYEKSEESEQYQKGFNDACNSILDELKKLTAE